MNLPLVATPKYKLTLPSNGKKYEYRPFLVGEQKLLMLALETGGDEEIMNAVYQVIDTCTFNKLDCKNLPSFDTEYIFIQLRSKSIGERIDLDVTCQFCGEKNDYELDLEKVKVQKDKDHSTKIQLTPTIGVIMRYPSTREVDDLKNNRTLEKVYKIITSCIDQIYDDETVYMAKDSTESEISAWLDNLSQEQFDKLEEFFDTMPRVESKIEFNCKKCKEDNTIIVEGIDSFFV